jgi:hypothetical protein
MRFNVLPSPAFRLNMERNEHELKLALHDEKREGVVQR